MPPKPNSGLQSLNSALTPASKTYLSYCLCVIAVALAGCAGYKLGPTGGFAPGDTSLQIAPFQNRTLEPLLTDAVASQIRKEVERDRTFKLATRDDGELMVSGVITKYDRYELSFAPEDTLTVRDYRLSLTAQIAVKDRATGRMILDQPVTGYTLIRVGTDFTSSERQALPLLAADLARNFVALLADGTW